MSTLEQSSHFGMPVPDATEQTILRSLSTFEVPEDYNNLDLDDVATLTKEHCPNIDAVVDQDLTCQENNDELSDYTEEECDQYQVGVLQGYDYIIGSMTYVNFMRSPYDNLDEYLSQGLHGSAELPVQNLSQLTRVINCLKGHIKVDAERLPEDVTNSAFIRWDTAGEYLFIAQLFDDLIDEATEAIELLSTSDSLNAARTSGFRRGIEGAILMYVESYQQAVIDRMEISFTGQG